MPLVFVIKMPTKIFVDENLSVDDVIMDPDVDGTIHNCVNNGDITIRGNYSGSSYTNSGEYYGVCRAAGITAINASILSSCFNLGNILNINYIIGADLMEVMLVSLKLTEESVS